MEGYFDQTSETSCNDAFRDLVRERTKNDKGLFSVMGVGENYEILVIGTESNKAEAIMTAEACSRNLTSRTTEGVYYVCDPSGEIVKESLPCNRGIQRIIFN